LRSPQSLTDAKASSDMDREAEGRSTILGGSQNAAQKTFGMGGISGRPHTSLNIVEYPPTIGLRGTRYVLTGPGLIRRCCLLRLSLKAWPTIHTACHQWRGQNNKPGKGGGLQHDESHETVWSESATSLVFSRLPSPRAPLESRSFGYVDDSAL
jgi:hypothetical protein